jgi:hypothetical protein
MRRNGEGCGRSTNDPPQNLMRQEVKVKVNLMIGTSARPQLVSFITKSDNASKKVMINSTASLKSSKGISGGGAVLAPVEGGCKKK